MQGSNHRTFIHAALAATAAAVMLFAIPNAVAAFKYLKTGMEVPDFSLESLEGEEIAFSGFKGSPATVVLFWATWSLRSRPALEDAQKLFAEYEDKGLKVLAVNVNRLNIRQEDRQRIREMKDEVGLGMPVAIDDGLVTYNAFGVVATPSTAVIDPEGRIVFEAASYLRSTGEDIRERVELLLGLREAPSAGEAVVEQAYRPVRKALLYYNLGRNLLRLDNREKALRKLEDAVAADEKFAAPRILLGHILLDQGTPEETARAEELFRDAVRIEGDNVSALSGLGEALLRLGRAGEAEELFRKAIELDPVYTPAVSSMALILAREGKAEEARSHFENALELNPLDPGTYFRRGESLEVRGDLSAAAADYRRAIEILMDLSGSGDEG